MSTRILFSLLIAALISCCIGGVHAESSSETSKRLKQVEADLKKARESLHVAHQELGDKAEVIRRLEGDLKKAAGSRRKKGGCAEEVTRLKRDLQAAKAKIQSLEKKLKMEAVAKLKKETEQAKVKAKAKAKAEPERPRIRAEKFKVNYELNSAANLEGRELALKWVQAQLKKNRNVKLAIHGLSNDREYEEANLAIAENRAKFLASYLRVSGVGADVITEVTGRISSASGKAGRLVEITTIPN